MSTEVRRLYVELVRQDLYRIVCATIGDAARQKRYVEIVFKTETERLFWVNYFLSTPTRDTARQEVETIILFAAFQCGMRLDFGGSLERIRNLIIETMDIDLPTPEDMPDLARLVATFPEEVSLSELYFAAYAAGVAFTKKKAMH